MASIWHNIKQMYLHTPLSPAHLEGDVFGGWAGKRTLRGASPALSWKKEAGSIYVSAKECVCVLHKKIVTFVF